MNKREFEKERRRQIKALLKASTPEEKRRIKARQQVGRRLRKQVEKL